MREEISRRRFLRGSALGLGGVLVGACSMRPESSDTVGAARPAGSTADTSQAAARASHIGVQLYTVRDLAKQDLGGTLRSVAEIGYREVEFAGYHGHEPAAIRGMLEEAGLTAPSAHVGLDELRGNPDRAVAAADVIGHRYLIVPWLQAPTTPEGWSRIAAELNGLGAALRERRIQLAYHNHDFELRPVERKVPYDLLLEECDPALVKMEMDLFWMVKGGGDPLSYFHRFPGRFPLVHVKDMRGPGGAEEMTEVGSGQLGFEQIFSASEKAGLVHYIVEHDDPADPLASIRTSYHNLHRMLASPTWLDSDTTSSNR